MQRGKENRWLSGMRWLGILLLVTGVTMISVLGTEFLMSRVAMTRSNSAATTGKNLPGPAPVRRNGDIGRIEPILPLDSFDVQRFAVSQAEFFPKAVIAGNQSIFVAVANYQESLFAVVRPNQRLTALPLSPLGRGEPLIKGSVTQDDVFLLAAKFHFSDSWDTFAVVDGVVKHLPLGSKRVYEADVTAQGERGFVFWIETDNDADLNYRADEWTLKYGEIDLKERGVLEPISLMRRTSTIQHLEAVADNGISWVFWNEPGNDFAWFFAVFRLSDQKEIRGPTRLCSGIRTREGDFLQALAENGTAYVWLPFAEGPTLLRINGDGSVTADCAPIPAKSVYRFQNFIPLRIREGILEGVEVSLEGWRRRLEVVRLKLDGTFVGTVSPRVEGYQVLPAWNRTVAIWREYIVTLSSGRDPYKNEWTGSVPSVTANRLDKYEEAKYLRLIPPVKQQVSWLTYFGNKEFVGITQAPGPPSPVVESRDGSQQVIRLIGPMHREAVVARKEMALILTLSEEWTESGLRGKLYYSRMTPQYDLLDTRSEVTKTSGQVRSISGAGDKWSFLAVWEDYRNHPEISSIYAARIDYLRGLLDAVGIPIDVRGSPAFSPAVIYDGSAFVVALGSEDGINIIRIEPQSGRPIGNRFKVEWVTRKPGWLADIRSKIRSRFLPPEVLTADIRLAFVHPHIWVCWAEALKTPGRTENLGDIYCTRVLANRRVVDKKPFVIRAGPQQKAFRLAGGSGEVSLWIATHKQFLEVEINRKGPPIIAQAINYPQFLNELTSWEVLATDTGWTFYLSGDSKDPIYDHRVLRWTFP